MFPFALTIFLGAFLLFQVQPIIARFILPWYGGTPAVWTTCVCFFQVALLVGYCYADFLARRLSPRVQGITHWIALVATLFFLPIVPSLSLKPQDSHAPIAGILWLLAVVIGPTYCLLATTGPLMQAWFSRLHPGRSPYRLFALSNFGSLLALISYPLFFEPMTTIRFQANLWSATYVVFLAASGWCAFQVIRRGAPLILNSNPVPNARGSWASVGAWKPMAWLVFSAIPSVLLLGVTNELSQDVAVVPLMWVVPLALYLLSFIICFDHSAWYRREVLGTLLILSAFASLYCLVVNIQVGYWVQFVAHNLLLFSACMCCHGELALMKPTVSRLTFFYLMIAVGGAMGGLCVVLVAPHLFVGYYEFPLAMLAALLLVTGRWIQSHDRKTLTRVMLMVSAIASTLLILGYLLYPIVVQNSELLRLHMVVSFWFVALSLLGWQHLVPIPKGVRPLKGPRGSDFLGDRSITRDRLETNDPARRATVVDRIWWILVVNALFVFSVAFIWQPLWMLNWGVPLSVVMIMAIWTVGVRTHDRPQVSFVVYANLAGVFLFFVLQVFGVYVAFREQGGPKHKILESRRSFFGISGVVSTQSVTDGPYQEIFNGHIGHGRQYERTDLRNSPNLYYGEPSGIAMALNEHPKRLRGQNLNIAVIGLGTGSLSVWGRAGDQMTFFEINPDVVELADRYFSYLGDSLAKTQAVIGDARILLEQDLSAGLRRNFDVLVVDAFTGDSIPRHLLTVEAMNIYREHLAAGGIVAIHISNHYLDLRPVVLGLAESNEMQAINIFDSSPETEIGRDRFSISNWMLVTNNLEFLQNPRVQVAIDRVPDRRIIWTDDFGSLLHVMMH